MADFKVVAQEELRTIPCVIESATVIEAGDMVNLTAGLIVKDNAAGARVAFAPTGSADGETTIQVTVGNDFVLEGTADANFAVTDKGLACDIVMNGTAQEIDIGTSSTDVFRVDISDTAGTAGSKLKVRVRINKPLF